MSRCRSALALGPALLAVSLAAGWAEGQEAGPRRAAPRPGTAAEPRPAAAERRAADRGGSGLSEASASVRRTSQPIRLDGALDEPAWRAADSIVDFTQLDPDEGAPATERTVVRFLSTAEALHVGFTGGHRDPSGIRAAQLRRDADFATDDSFTLLLDPQGDRRSGYVFSVNPNAALYDAEIVAVGLVDSEWDGIWDARARRTPAGWTAEISIPWSTLRYPAGDRPWGLNLARFIRARNEEVLWRGWRRSHGLLHQEAQGSLTGLGSLPGRSLELRPYAAVSRAREDPGRNEDPAPDEDPGPGDEPARLTPAADDEVKLGGEAKLAVAPTLTLDLTVNTDFAQVEVDEQVVNLTRFPLFFPERRPFFLEGSGVFDFGDPEETQLFYSRRIGLDDDGATVPLVAGARLQGRAGPYRVGALAVRTGGEEKALDLVGRVQRDVLSRGYVGAMLTSQSGPGAAARWGLGADTRLPLVLGDQNLILSGYGAAAGEGGSDAAAAWGLLVDGPNELVDYFAGVSGVGQGFDPALGFVESDGVRRYIGGLRLLPRPPIEGLRSLDLEVLSWYVLRDLAGDPITAEHRVRPLGLRLESGDEGQLNLTRLDEVFREDFEIFPGSVLPAGSYRDTRVELAVASSRGRPVSLDARLSAGGFYDGTSTDLDLELAARVAPHVIAALEYGAEAVRRQEERFTARVARARLDVAGSPRLGTTLFAQWENESDRLTLNARLRWTPRPGTDVYLVWNRGWLAGADPGDPRGRGKTGALIGKIVHSFTP